MEPAIYLKRYASVWGSALIALVTSLGAYVAQKDIIEDVWACFLISFTLSFLIWQGNHYIHHTLEKKYPLEHRTVKKIFLQITFNTLYTSLMIVGFLIVYFNYFIHKNLSSKIVFTEVFTSIILSLLINAIYIGTFFFQKMKESIGESEKLKRENIQSQYETLKNQVSPHFLFNSLNTLATIIPEDPKLAVDFVQKLSSVYRYVLQNKDKELVSLQTEIDFVQDYFFLLKIRFGENIHLMSSIPDVFLYKHVPPLTLQMLLENAIKHNIISTANPLCINLYVEKDNRLMVKNNLQKKILETESTGIGLQNIVNRYKFLTKHPVETIITQDNFMVSLPLLTIG